MIYPSGNCWPDLRDLQSVLNKHFKDKELPAEDLYQDFRASYEWLHMAIHASHWKGKHATQPMSIVKELAEGYIGRVLNPDAFLAATYVAAGSRLKHMKKAFEELTIKVPPFDVDKIAVIWKQHVADVELESQKVQLDRTGGNNGS